MAALRRFGSSASWLLSSSSSVAGPSSSGSVCFSTSAQCGAVAKKKAAPKAKKKTVVRKTSAPSQSKQKRKGGGSDSSLGVSRANPYVQQPANMSSLPEFLPEVATQENVYNVMAWSRRTLEATRFQAFGLTKGIARQFATEPRPRTLIRPHTLDVLDTLDKSRSSPTPNTLFQAPIGYGVSTLLLQAFSYALESSWIVIYLPRTVGLVDSSSPYVYSETHQAYVQPELTRNLLQRILEVNKGQLSKIALQDGPFTLDGGSKVEQGTNLAAVIQEGLRSDASPAAVHTIFEVVMRAIVQQRQTPTLLALDGVQGLFSTSLYRDPDYRKLASYELGVPRTIQACLRREGVGSFGGVQSGATLTAMSLTNTKWPVPPEMTAALRLQPPVDVYRKLDEGMLSIIRDSQFRVWDLAHAVLTRKEAGALFDVARKEGSLWSMPNDEMLVTKLVESGGNLSIFQRSLYGSLL